MNVIDNDHSASFLFARYLPYATLLFDHVQVTTFANIAARSVVRNVWKFRYRCYDSPRLALFHAATVNPRLAPKRLRGETALRNEQIDRSRCRFGSLKAISLRTRIESACQIVRLFV